ncbi:GNAT family N-acetyltransferase [Sandarakinorhabdus sp.]|uniref:GNAT family N-acetyltransferase n=1 Tax=Sandarakinorhabdus sp. TaxID=1916663 RepID=UPI003F7164C5
MAGDSAGLSVRRLGPDDLALLLGAGTLFDDPLRPDMAARFLAHPDHHLFAAVHAGKMIGFVSAMSYLHPDKPLEYWLNEVGVNEAWHRCGVGRRLMMAALDHSWRLGCTAAWVLTNSSNRAARGLYAACGGTATPAARHGDSVIMFSFAPPP